MPLLCSGLFPLPTYLNHCFLSLFYSFTFIMIYYNKNSFRYWLLLGRPCGVINKTTHASCFGISYKNPRHSVWYAHTVSCMQMTLGYPRLLYYYVYFMFYCHFGACLGLRHAPDVRRRNELKKTTPNSY